MMKDYQLFAVLALSVLYFFPFLNTPFGTDPGDPKYIGLAKDIRSNSFRMPLAQVTSVYHGCYGKMNTNGPVIPYYIAIVQSLFGESEIPLHVAFLLFKVIGAYSIYMLAQKFIGSGFLAALLFLFNPYILGNTLNVKTDLAFTALFLASLLLFVEGVDRNSRNRRLASGVLAGLVILTKYTGFLLIPLFLFYIFFVTKNEKNPSKYAVCFAIPIAIFLLWEVHNIVFFGRVHFVEQMGFTQRQGGAFLNIYDKLAGTFSFVSLGSAFKYSTGTLSYLLDLAGAPKWPATALPIAINLVFPIFFLSVFSNGRPKELLAVMLLAFGAALLTKPIAAFVVAGIFIVSKIILQIFEKSPFVRFLVFWVALQLFYNLFVLPEFTIRYLLPLVPPVSILAAGRMTKRRAGLGILLLVFLSLCSIGMFQNYPLHAWADANKAFADQMASTYSRNATWVCDGTTVGYYLNKLGFMNVCYNGEPPKEGDVIVRTTAGGCAFESFVKCCPSWDGKADLVRELDWNMGPDRHHQIQVFRVG